METRRQVLQLLAAGRSQAQIASALGLSKSTVAYHARRVREPDPRFRRRYDWEAVQAFYDLGHTVDECVARFGFSKQTWHAAKNRGAIVTRSRAMPIEQLLAAPRNRTHLKRRLVGAGLLPDRCQSCGICQWRGRPLSLELHHINGNGQDNRLANLSLLCPNCHSQTDTWGGRNSGRPLLRLIGGGPGASAGSTSPSRAVSLVRSAPVHTGGPPANDAA